MFIVKEDFVRTKGKMAIEETSEQEQEMDEWLPS